MDGLRQVVRLVVEAPYVSTNGEKQIVKTVMGVKYVSMVTIKAVVRIVATTIVVMER
jgi:hypothetical protein